MVHERAGYRLKKTYTKPGVALYEVAAYFIAGTEGLDGSHDKVAVDATSVY